MNGVSRDLPALSKEKLRLANNIYEARRSAKFLLGDAYEERIEQWTRLIRLAMEREKKAALPAMLVLSKHSESGMDGLFLMAAALEVIERDAPKPRACLSHDPIYDPMCRACRRASSDAGLPTVAPSSPTEGQR